MDSPARVQRQRTKGWRMPENTVYVGRPTKWGNPFKVGDIWDQAFVWHLPSWSAADTENGETRLTRALAVELYREQVDPTELPLSQLRGFDLACWCPLGEPCHADVLLDLANEEATRG